MSHLLHLDSSLRTDGSRSRKLSAHYANRWRAKNPDGTVTYRDLTVDPVPHLDNISVSADLVAASERTSARPPPAPWPRSSPAKSSPQTPSSSGFRCTTSGHPAPLRRGSTGSSSAP